VAAELGLVLVTPDTSPREPTLPGDRDVWDLGQGAGFYVDATESPWCDHYRMFSWVTEELPALLAARFPADPARFGVSGHSMGGHGALVAALRRPDVFRSCSAFAPIAAAAEGLPRGIGAAVMSFVDAVSLLISSRADAAIAEGPQQAHRDQCLATARGGGRHHDGLSQPGSP
jgi:S-formylglutathione hydrolase